MRPKTSLRGRCVAPALICAFAPSVAMATEMAYTITVDDPSSGVVDVSFALTDYPYPTAQILLAEAAVDPESYFTFFDELTLTGSDGASLTPSRPMAGVMEVDGIAGEVHGAYRVLIGDLVRAFGSSARMPALSAAHTVLPLRALLAMPIEIETRGLVFDRLTLRVEFPDGWSVLTPWRTYDKTVSFGEYGLGDLRSGIVVGGDFAIREALQESSPTLRLFRGGSAEEVDRIDDLVHDIVAYYSNVFGSRGQRPITTVVEFGTERGDVEVQGHFFRIQCPTGYALATPEEIRFGTEAFAFYHELTHELFHHWIGTSGMVAPLGTEGVWLSEGGADYFGALALSSLGIVTSEEPLRYLASVADRLGARDDRGRRINESAAVHDGDAEYRRLVRIKAPLVCFYLDTQLLTTRHENTSLATAVKRMFYTAFMRDRRMGANFTEEELAGAMEGLMGMRGPLVLSRALRSDILPELAEKAAEVGLRWQHEDGFTGHEVSVSDPETAAFGRVLFEREQTR